MQHPHMLNKPNNNLGALPGHLARSVQAVDEPVGISPGWNTTGTSPGWEPHAEQCWWIQHCLLSWPAALEQWPNTCKRDKGTVWRLWSYLCPEGFLHLGSSFSFKGTASFSKSMERHGVFWLGWSDWIHFTSSRDLPFGYLKKWITAFWISEMHLFFHKNNLKNQHFLFLVEVEMNTKFHYFFFCAGCAWKTAVCEALQQSQASGGEPAALPMHRDSSVTNMSCCLLWVLPLARPCALCRVCVHTHECVWGHI